MPSPASRSRAAARRQLAAEYLRRLLLEREAYRSRWSYVAGKTPPGVISQAAVARVIVDHLRKAGSETGETDFRLLKDRVQRALSGRALTSATLDLFAAAFQLIDEDIQHLRAVLVGARQEQDAFDLIPARTVIGLSDDEVAWLRTRLDVLREGGDMDMAEAIIAKLC